MATDFDRRPSAEGSGGTAAAPALLERLFHSALDVPADRREEWIEDRCREGVAREVARRAATLAGYVDDEVDARGKRPRGAGFPRLALAVAVVLAAVVGGRTIDPTAVPEGAVMRSRPTVLTAVASSFIAATAASAQQAVQWRVEDGGNGHWYRLELAPMTWLTARALAQSLGGDLSSLETASELEWCRINFLSVLEYVNIGGIQQQPATTPAEGWFWLTGDPVQAMVNADDNPCACGTSVEDGQQDYLHSSGFGSMLGDANSAAVCGSSGCVWEQAALIEWSADCNGDGIVDYGQILQGQLVDANSNGVPDGCEPAPCLGDLDGSGAVTAIDLAIVLSNWGVAGPKYPQADLNGDGLVDALDLAQVLSDWGPCPK